MNTFMQIVTLQNSTFNGWAWVIGAVILLVIAGMGFDEDPGTAVIFGACSLFWPMFLVVGIVIAIISTPIWVGRKINTMLRDR